MNFKFRNLLMTAGALLAFTACSNDSDGIPQEPEAQLSDLTIRVETYKAPATRGVVEDPLKNNQGENGEEIKAVADKAIAYIMDGNRVAHTSKVFDIKTEEGKEVGNYTFKDILVSGNEKVKVVAYKNDVSKVAEDYEIYELQPKEGAAGIVNSIYSGEEGMGSATITEGKKQYTVNLSLTSLTARLELMGEIGFNEELVKNLNLTTITPIQFRVKYKDALAEIITPQNVDPLNALWYNFKPNGENDVYGIEENKALANHLFAGDKLAFAVGIKPDLYVCEKDDAGAYVKLNYAEKGEDEKYSAVYRVDEVVGEEKTSKYYILKDDDSFYHVSKSKEGKYSIGEKADNFNFKSLAIEQLKDDEGKPYVSFFNMVGNKEITGGKYDGGFIYKVKLNDLNWGGGSNNYSPDVNTGNPEEPEEKEEADVIVKATVLPWTVKNTTAGLE